jgi:ABC-type branched-subunit amino acid transport system substrate-binding protein
MCYKNCTPVVGKQKQFPTDNGAAATCEAASPGLSPNKGEEIAMREENDENPVEMTRRRFLAGTAWMTSAITTGVGSWVIRPGWANAAEGPIKIGIATDLTGAIGMAGHANANVAKMVIQDINDAGGVLGRPIELHIEDTASNESVAVANVRKLIQRDKVDVVLGGITSSMRNAIKDVIVTRGKTLYIYPQLYEGKECMPYLFCTGPTPAQQCDDFIPWLMKNGGRRFALPSANYVWPHVLNAYARQIIERNGGEVIFEEYYPLDQVEYSATVNRVMTNNVDVIFNTVIPPGVGPFIKQLYEAGFSKRGGRLSCVYYDDGLVLINAPYEMEGLASCLDYFRAVDHFDSFSAKLQAKYEKEFPGDIPFTAGTGATGMYRGLKLWEAAVKEAGKLDRDGVAAAFDHAKIAEGPGGPAEMVPGKRHCKMQMYTAVAKNGKYEVVARSDGLVDPKEC